MTINIGQLDMKFCNQIFFSGSRLGNPCPLASSVCEIASSPCLYYAKINVACPFVNDHSKLLYTIGLMYPLFFVYSASLWKWNICIILRVNKLNQAFLIYFFYTEKLTEVLSNFQLMFNQIQPKFKWWVIGLWPTLPQTFMKIGAILFGSGSGSQYRSTCEIKISDVITNVFEALRGIPALDHDNTSRISRHVRYCAFQKKN